VRLPLTNGRRTFVVGDGSSQWGRRWRDLVAGHIGDLGGPEGLSEAQRSLCQRAACLEVEVELERMEGALSLGEEVCLDSYGRAVGQLSLDAILPDLAVTRAPSSTINEPA